MCHLLPVTKKGSHACSCDSRTHQRVVMTRWWLDPASQVGGSPQRVVVTRWGLLGPASREENHQRVITTHWWLDPVSQVEGSPQRAIVTRWGLFGPALREETSWKPPTSHHDSLVAGSGVASERESPNESRRLVGGC